MKAGVTNRIDTQDVAEGFLGMFGEMGNEVVQARTREEINVHVNILLCEYLPAQVTLIRDERDEINSIRIAELKVQSRKLLSRESDLVRDFHAGPGLLFTCKKPGSHIVENGTNPRSGPDQISGLDLAI